MTGRFALIVCAILLMVGLAWWVVSLGDGGGGERLDRDQAAGDVAPLRPEDPARLVGRTEEQAGDGTATDSRPGEPATPTFPLTVVLYLVDVEPHPVRVSLRDGKGVLREKVIEQGVEADFGEVAEGSVLAWAQGEGAAAIARSQSLRGVKGRPWRFEYVFLFPAGPLEGTVVDATTGRGVPGATVRFQGMRSGASSPAWKTAASDEGHFRLEAVPVVPCGRNGPQIRSPGLVALAPGYAQQRVHLTWDEVKAGGPLRIEMTSGGTVSGRVRDHALRPIGGAPVLAIPLLRKELGSIRGSYATRLPIDIAAGRTVALRHAGADFHPFALSQALGIGPGEPHPLATRAAPDGTYAVEGLTLGIPWVVVADVEDRPLSGPHEFLPTADEPEGTADLLVGRYGRLRLDVVDAAGRAVDGVVAWRVGLHQRRLQEGGGLYETIPLKTVEDEDAVGTALGLDPCPPGPVRVLLRAPGFLLQDVRLDVTPGTTTRHEVRLKRGLTVRGRIEGPDGAPLYYAFVRLIPKEPPPDYYFFDGTWEAKTGEDGLYQFTGLRPGPYRLEASHFLHRPVETTLVLETHEVETNLRVLPLHTVELEVALADGADLPDMILVMQNGEWIHPDHSDLRFDRLRRGVRTYEMGEYVVLEGGRGTLRFYEGQEYVIVAHEGYAPFIRKVDPEHDDTLLVRLETGRALEGTVVDEDGTPVAGAAVAPVESFFTCAHRVETNDEGRFVIPDMGPGPYELYAWARGFPEHVFHVVAPVPEAPVRLTLPRGVVVNGTVWASQGRPAPTGTRVTIARATDESTLEPIRTAHTGVRGAFAVALDPGRYRIEASHEHSSAHGVITVAAGREARIELTLGR